MKVLKFGGSSVANSQNIQRVVQIVQKVAAEEKVAVVVSAFGKTTNNLIAAASLATAQNPDYLDLFDRVSQLHLQVVDDLVAPDRKAETTRGVTQLFQQLKTLLEGCFLLREVTPKTMATISGFGELLSSYIISEVAKNTMDASYKDSRELIVTSNGFEKAQVNFKETNANCVAF